MFAFCGRAGVRVYGVYARADTPGLICSTMLRRRASGNNDARTSVLIHSPSRPGKTVFCGRRERERETRKRGTRLVRIRSADSRRESRARDETNLASHKFRRTLIGARALSLVQKNVVPFTRSLARRVLLPHRVLPRRRVTSAEHF